jgi:hypothetical protein
MYENKKKTSQRQDEPPIFLTGRAKDSSGIE